MNQSSEEWKLRVLKAHYSFIIILLSELIYRIFLIIREIISYKKYYPQKNRLLNTIQHGFTFITIKAKVCYMFTIPIVATIAISLFLPETNGNINVWIDCEQLYYLVPLYILIRYIGISQGSIEQKEWIRSGNGLDYATGMASNYFHGYLLLALANKSDNDKGLIDRIRDYEDEHNITFALQKLIIIIPDSFHCPPKIDSPYLKPAAPLETVIKLRAGVNRPFKNDVYRFTEKINGKNYYIAVEGATPLLSYKESMNDTLTGTSEMRAMQREILIQFYKSLKKFTSKCEYTRNECEIVYYPDYNPNGEHNDIGIYLKNYLENRLRNEDMDE